jgi:UDP-N-acetylglucosamine--N-acetylmuramyl-(pentapeptide) pyrophosphoryl-undecaprenol N-acetylglucosamine transferase
MEAMGDVNLKPYQKIVPYLDDMASALAASDIVIGSAGAISLAEITAMGKPSIIIPKAYTAENHQEYNARSIQNNGAGVAILEKELTPKHLNETIFRLLGDREALISMENASRSIGKPDALDLIYKEIMEVYKANQKPEKVKKEKIIDDKKIDENSEENKEEPRVIGIKKKK